jgi:hypothetical protein
MKLHVHEYPAQLRSPDDFFKPRNQRMCGSLRTMWRPLRFGSCKVFGCSHSTYSLDHCQEGFIGCSLSGQMLHLITLALAKVGIITLTGQGGGITLLALLQQFCAEDARDSLLWFLQSVGYVHVVPTVSRICACGSYSQQDMCMWILQSVEYVHVDPTVSRICACGSYSQ